MVIRATKKMRKYNLEEKLVNGERNERRAHCYLEGCGCRIEKGNGYKIFIPSRGVRVVCNYHNTIGGLLDYHGNARRAQEQELRVLGSFKHTELASITMGVEFEVYIRGMSDARVNTLRNLICRSFECYAERDCTVSMEMPTLPVRGLGKFSKVLQSLEEHNMLEALNNENCGAHCHGGVDNIQLIRRFYHSLFLELSNYLESLSIKKRVEFFGRDFNQWARAINRDTYPQEHTNFINTQHSHSLEFRLPRVTGYKQYLEVMKTWRECILEINLWCSSFEESWSVEDKRKSAKECGEKIVNIFKEHIGE